MYLFEAALRLNEMGAVVASSALARFIIFNPLSFIFKMLHYKLEVYARAV